MTKRNGKRGLAGLVDSTKRFEEEARQLRESQERDGRSSSSESQTLGGKAKDFAENAEKLKRKYEPTNPTLETVEQEVRGGAANQFLDASKNLNARAYSNEQIIPKIDGLINRHIDGSGIPKSEVESTFTDIMNQMVQDGIMIQAEMNAYMEPQLIQETRRIQTGTKMVPRNEKDRGLLNQFGNFLSGKRTEMAEVPVYKTQKVTVEGPSKFQQDIAESIEFNDQGKVESPNHQTFKDKLMYGLSKICNSLGLKDLAKSCRQSISKENLEKTYKAEKGFSDLTNKLANQARSIGNKAETPEAKRVGERTQNILAQRQQTKKSGGRSR